MSINAFLKSAARNYSQIGTFVPSSRYLADMMTNKQLIENSEVIVELGAGTGAITEYILKKLPEENHKKVFVFEKDEDMFKQLQKLSLPGNVYLLKENVLNINEVLDSYEIKKVDLVISALPFRSLPENVYKFVMEDFFSRFFEKQTHLIQLSYFRSSLKLFETYFENITTQRCVLNIPPMACVFNCYGYENMKKSSGS